MARILVVNDEEELVDAYVLILEAAGHKASGVIGGERAVGAARTEQPDLIILDWMMPGMQGDEVLRELRSSPCTSSIPILMASGLVGAAEQSRRLGADAFLSKPFQAGELLRLVEDLSTPR